MIRFTQGNLLDAPAEALVNTVNTVGVMGKGIALMFKEAYRENFNLYKAACKAGRVEVGQMFVTEPNILMGPKWIINFPTKKHWRAPSRMTWVSSGLEDLHRIIKEKGIRSIALPPLGSGNGGLDWERVRMEIIDKLSDLEEVEILVYEPSPTYQNISKKTGVQELTPARALIAEIIRRYWVLGIECSLLEIQKLAWFLERNINSLKVDNPLQLQFSADKYGPYANRLDHLLNALDGSYLHSDRRIADAAPTDVIAFKDSKRQYVDAYLKTPEMKPYSKALERTGKVIDGFESPLGMELLATVDWLICRDNYSPDLAGVKKGLAEWLNGGNAAERKMRIFADSHIQLSLERLKSLELV